MTRNLTLTMDLDGYQAIHVRFPMSDDFGNVTASEVCALLGDALNELMVSRREAEDPTLAERTPEAAMRRIELYRAEVHLSDLWNEAVAL